MDISDLSEYKKRVESSNKYTLIRGDMETTKRKEVFTFDVEMARKILKAREALIINDVDDAYHQLCAIADPTLTSPDHWKALEEFVVGKQKGVVMESTKEEPLTRKWIFTAEIPNGEFCLDENGNEINRDDADCKCFIGTIIEASKELTRRGILHVNQHHSFLSCKITYESLGIVEQK